MNLFIVRTRLQCLIARHIATNVTEKQEFEVLFLYQHHRSEDSEHVYLCYDELRKLAVNSHDIVSSDGLFRNALSIYVTLRQVARNRGSVFLAVIDSAPVAIALVLLKNLPVFTFDDGAFNLIENSRYYSETPFLGQGWRRRISRRIFPKGVMRWMRDRSLLHYTIFSGKRNILPEGRIVNLDWEWSHLLDECDLVKIDEKARIVVLGTPHDEFPDPDASRELARVLAGIADIYIPHPREGQWLSAPNVVDMKSPAEAIITHLAKSHSVCVYHFNSTVGFSLDGQPNVHLVNLVSPATRMVRADVEMPHASDGVISKSEAG